MLGLGDTASVGVPCHFWEERVSTGDSQECKITAMSVFKVPASAIGWGEDESHSLIVSTIVWGGLAYLLFLSGKR